MEKNIMPAFRIHFENEHLDIDAPTAELARQRALRARPGQIITKSKLIDPRATKAAIKEHRNVANATARVSGNAARSTSSNVVGERDAPATDTSED